MWADDGPRWIRLRPRWADDTSMWAEGRPRRIRLQPRWAESKSMWADGRPGRIRLRPRWADDASMWAEHPVGRIHEASRPTDPPSWTSRHRGAAQGGPFPSSTLVPADPYKEHSVACRTARPGSLTTDANPTSRRSRHRRTAPADASPRRFAQPPRPPPPGDESPG
jgi:hypothetical protein